MLISILWRNKSSAVAEMGERLATIDVARKVGGCCAVPHSAGDGSPSNTMSPGPRPTSTKWHPNPSNRLATIHQRYKTDGQTDRQTDRTDNSLSIDV